MTTSLAGLDINQYDQLTQPLMAKFRTIIWIPLYTSRNTGSQYMVADYVRTTESSFRRRTLKKYSSANCPNTSTHGESQCTYRNESGINQRLNAQRKSDDRMLR